MYKETNVKGGSKIIITDETPTGVVNLIIVDENGVEKHARLSNSQVFSLALDLLSCVEHIR